MQFAYGRSFQTVVFLPQSVRVFNNWGLQTSQRCHENLFYPISNKTINSYFLLLEHIYENSI